MRTAPRIGTGLLLGLWATSFLFSAVWPEVLRRHCVLGHDLVRPDETICSLALGGLWVSLSMGLLAAALSVGLAVGLALLIRWVGGRLEGGALRVAEAYYALPDVLVLMVIHFAAQTAGDLNPAFRVAPMLLMVLSLAAVGWAGPLSMIRNRMVTLEAQEFVAAGRALGGSRWHLLRTHLWPGLKPYVAALFLARLPAAILAESTVSFFGIARVEPISLGRYLGTSYGALLYDGGARVVLPAWFLLVLIVFGAGLASRGIEAGSTAKGH